MHNELCYLFRLLSRNGNERTEMKLSKFLAWLALLSTLATVSLWFLEGLWVSMSHITVWLTVFLLAVSYISYIDEQEEK